MHWFGFWIFMAVVFACDSWLHAKGLNTFFWSYKTEEEKELQRLIIDERRKQ